MKKTLMFSFFALSNRILASDNFIAQACKEQNISDLVKEVVFKNNGSIIESLELSINAGDFFVPLVLVFFAGFLTSLSPCIYPLIPITLSVMGARDYKNRLQGFLVSLAYVFGMSIVYCILGILFASFGILAGSIMQNSLTLVILSFFLMLMAFSMWGIINFNLPPGISSKLAKVGKKGFKGAFVMGLAAGLIAAPCTGPVLGFILALIAKGQNLIFASSLMLSFSFGLGILFLFLGTFSSTISLLPKSGKWMAAIKYFFGAIMLAASFYYFSLIFSNVNNFFVDLKKTGLFLTISFLLFFLFLGLYLTFKNFKRVLLIHISFALASVFLAVSFRWTSLIDPKEAQINPLKWHVFDYNTQDMSDFESHLEQAKENCQNIVIDFYADWCVACRELENTFHDKRVSDVLNNFHLIRIDATNNSKIIAQIQKKYGIVGLPTLVFLDKNLEEFVTLRTTGFLRADQLLGKLSQKS